MSKPYNGIGYTKLTAADYAALGARPEPSSDIRAAFSLNGSVGDTRSGPRGATADMAYWMKDATGLTFEQLFDKKKNDKYFLSDAGKRLLTDWQKKHGTSGDAVVGQDTVDKMVAAKKGSPSQPADEHSAGIIMAPEPTYKRGALAADAHGAGIITTAQVAKSTKGAGPA